MVTKIKRTFGTSPTELLIYYKSYLPIINQIFYNHLIEIVNCKADKHRYEQLTRDKRFNIIGTNTIAELSVPEIVYINLVNVNLMIKWKSENTIFGFLVLTLYFMLTVSYL